MEKNVNLIQLHTKTANENSAAPAVSAARVEREPVSYKEVPGLTHETRDVLKQLDANIRLLEDLGGRLEYVLTEVRGVIRK